MVDLTAEDQSYEVWRKFSGMDDKMGGGERRYAEMQWGREARDLDEARWKWEVGT